MKHTSHPDIIKRLKQAQGQLVSLLAMFEGGRACMDLAQQLQAVGSIIHAAKRTLIYDHMEHCIGDPWAFEATQCHPCHFFCNKAQRTPGSLSRLSEEAMGFALPPKAC